VNQRPLLHDSPCHGRLHLSRRLCSLAASSCLVPAFDGAYFSEREKESLCLPEVDAESPRSNSSILYPIGFFHIDLAEVRSAECKLYLFVAINRISKFAANRTR
jgi:hypothetical protein